MPNIHVTNLLDGERLAALSSAELAEIQTHVRHCATCLAGWEAARLSTALLRARAGETVRPSVFFPARVAAALRERRIAEQPAALLRMWKSAGIMVAAMLAVVVILLTLTLSDHGAGRTESSEISSRSGRYSVDRVVLDDPNQPADESQGVAQDLDSLFESEEGYGPN